MSAPGPQSNVTPELISERWDTASISPSLTLSEQELHVWFYPLASSSSGALDWTSAPTLDDQEQQRAARFATAELRADFCTAHEAKRQLLARYLNCPPAKLRFDALQYGKPILADEPLHFNLSHSGGWAVLAVARHALGVDLEVIDQAGRWQQLVSQVAHQNDQLDRPESFYGCWCAKEAVSKWDGRGLGIPFPHLRLDPLSRGWLAVREDRPMGECRVYNLPAPEGFAAAVACPTPVKRIVCRLP
ncbi:MAG: hypothetical protein Tsb002_15100 [Wenzhouxiangellaceae bacterium]